jgi:4-amino-4-deoxy-L-arabinose transferase-like glycosyltransferase
MNALISFFLRDKAFAVLLVLALTLRLAFVFVHQRPLISDERDYHQLAVSLLETGKYGIGGAPTAYRPVGYPALLAATYFLFGPHPIVIKIFQAIVDTFIALILSLLVPPHHPKQQILACGFWAFYVPAILYTNVVLSETIFTFAITLLCFTMIKSDFRSTRVTFAIGIFFGLITLIKPATLFFLFTIVVLLPFVRVPVRRTIVLLIGSCIILLPWLMRNYVALGSFTLVTSTGINLLIGNNPAATGAYTANIPSAILQGATTEAQVSRIATDYALAYVQANPGQFLINGVKKLAHLFSSEGALLVWSFYAESETTGKPFATKYATLPLPVVFLTNISYMITLLLGTSGFITLAGRDRQWWFVGAFLFSWLVIHVVFFGGSRFHFPLMPFAALYASNVLVNARQMFSQHSSAHRFVIFGTVLFFLSVWITEFLIVVRN